jgi:hypothetical protein
MADFNEETGPMPEIYTFWMFRMLQKLTKQAKNVYITKT